MTTTLAGRAPRALGTAWPAAHAAASALGAAGIGRAGDSLGPVRTVTETRVRATRSSMGRFLGLVLAGRTFALPAEEGARSKVTDGPRKAWLRTSALSRVAASETASAEALEPVPEVVATGPAPEPRPRATPVVAVERPPTPSQRPSTGRCSRAADRLPRLDAGPPRRG
jgi:hypothetical protein